MKRPNRKDYIKKASIIQLLADLEIYIDYLEAQAKQLILSGVVSTSKCDHEPKNFNKKYTSCKKCEMHLQMKP
tara:strand:+ start:1745 stop:1963 length:219 start_codon:yes stop_codon:yes gene_type:complete